jgi:hypothetical protein
MRSPVSTNLWEFVIALVFTMAWATTSAALLLDDVPPGDLASWTIVDDPAQNPPLVVEEITSPFDGSTAIRTSVTSIPLNDGSCETTEVSRIFPLGPGNSSNASLFAYLEFAFSGTQFNFPYVVVALLDDQSNELGHHNWYGKGIVGSYYQSTIASNPAAYTEFSTASGFMEMNLGDIGPNILFTKLRVVISNYTCVGANSIIIDHLEISSAPDGDSDGIVDGGDNCPTTYNPDQEDTDGDTLGDLCDPFPGQADHEKAQCFVDLSAQQAITEQCLADLSSQVAVASQCAADLAAQIMDTDGDGTRDIDDLCPGTIVATPTDRDGCSLAQFCERMEAVTAAGKRTCRKSDWGNDEPLMKSRDTDCRVDIGMRGAGDDRCVATAP